MDRPTRRDYLTPLPGSCTASERRVIVASGTMGGPAPRAARGRRVRAPAIQAWVIGTNGVEHLGDR
ncbi:MAG TPA: hypothetical protein VK116_14005, partial [Planctomycetota bacterium]|nr:hypothetical protein [Planctomycetota bacterium]